MLVFLNDRTGNNGKEHENYYIILGYILGLYRGLGLYWEDQHVLLKKNYGHHEKYPVTLGV